MGLDVCVEKLKKCPGETIGIRLSDCSAVQLIATETEMETIFVYAEIEVPEACARVHF